MARRTTETSRRGRTASASRDQPETEQPPEGLETDAEDGEQDELAPFRDLGTGEIISVTRTSPIGPGSGWLDQIQVPAGGVDDLRSVIRDRWGGGQYLLQRKQRLKNGKVVWARKSARVQIAGSPKVAAAEPDPAAAPAVAPVVFQPPAQSQEPMVRLVEALVQSVRAGQTTPGQAFDLTKVAELIFQATQGQRPAEPPRDAFGELERMAKTMQRMREVFGVAEQSRDDDDDDGAFGGLLSGRRGAMLGEALLKRMLNDEQPSPNGQPMPMPPPPSPHHVYHPGRGWFLPPVSAPTGPGPTQNPTAPPASPPPAEGMVEDGDDEEPLTADDVIADIEDLEPAERDRLIPALLERVGIDPSAFADAAKELEKNEQGSPSQIDLGESYPITSET